MTRRKKIRRFFGALMTPAHLAFIQLDHTRKGYVVTSAGRFSLPDGLDSAKQYLSMHKPATPRLHLIIPDKDTTSKEAVLPPRKGKMLDAGIQELLAGEAGGPFPMTAHADLGPAGDRSRDRKILACGMKPGALGPFLPTLKMLDLKLAWITPLSLTLPGLGIGVDRGNRGDVDRAVLHVNETDAILLVHRGSQVLFRKVLRRSLPHVLHYENTDWNHPEPGRRCEIGETPGKLRKEAESLAEETGRVLAYIENREIARVVSLTLSGNLKRDRAMEENFSARFGIPVGRTDPGNGKSVPGILTGNPALLDLYAPVTGFLRLYSRGNLPNLFRRPTQPPSAILRPLTSAAAAAALTLGGFSLAGTHAESAIHQQTLRGLAPLPESKELKDPDARARKYLTGSPLPHALAGLSKIAPDNLILRNMKLHRTAGKWILEVEGAARPMADTDPLAALGSFMTGLEKEAWIARVEADPWTMNEKTGVDEGGGWPRGTLLFRCHCQISAFGRAEAAGEDGGLEGSQDELFSEGY